MSAALANLCRGRWPDILRRLGVLSSAALAGKDVPCPVCGGHDRSRYSDKEFGRWFCRGCGMGGDGLRLIQTIKRVDFQTAAALVETIVGKVDASKSRAKLGGGKSDRPSDPMKPWREAGPFLVTRRLIDISAPARSLSPRAKRDLCAMRGASFTGHRKRIGRAQSPRSRSPPARLSVAIRHSSSRRARQSAD